MRDELISSSRFCTECGEELDEYSLDNKSVDSKLAKLRHENCKKTGKFKGDLCSRVFISDFTEYQIPNDELRDDIEFNSDDSAY
ncbi:MAG: hypothetical protein WCJ01_04125 [Ignavibacteria bacterium]